jgi:hypothetical protein
MADDEDTGDTGGKTVPYEKFAASRRERAEALQRAADAEAAVSAAAAEVAALRTSVGGYEAQIEAARQEAARYQADLDRFRAGVAVGITDPEVIEAAVWAHGKLPEEGRPDFAAALAAWKEAPDTAPVVVRPFFGTTATTRTSDPAKPKGPTSGAQTYTPDRIAALIASGEYAQHRDAIAAQMAAERGGR